LVDTATRSAPLLNTRGTDAYPGDDPFSRDGAWVRWFTAADESFIGDVQTRRTSGEGEPIQLGPRGWYVLDTADPDRLCLLVNARRSAQSRRIYADLALRRQDGLDGLEILIQGVDATAFRMFPRRDRVVYVIPDGVHAGVWSRQL
jgi:hypothetical protein